MMPPGQNCGKGVGMPDAATISAWGMATMGKGPGPSPAVPSGPGGPSWGGAMMGMSGVPMQMKGGPVPMGMMPMSGGSGGPMFMNGSMPMQMPAFDSGKAKGKGRPVEMTRDEDWESLGRHRQQGGTTAPGDLNHVLERSLGTD